MVRAVSETFTAIAGLDACLGWLLGLALIVVGFAVVAKAHRTAGFVVAAAGGVKLLVNCCAVWPQIYQQVEGYDSDMATLFEVSVWVALLLRVLSYGLLIAGAAMAAKAILARRAVGGAP